jgi:2-(1,2-epoxy-1,2-dihydrophenyl)acetyl-CoA isomerase
MKTAPSEVVVTDHPAPGTMLVVLNRPEARNALSWESWTELDAALDEAADPSTRVVVLTGSGGYFSAGGDLKTPPAGGTGPFSAVSRLELAQHVLHRIQTLTVPVIAAVEGCAIGLGWSLALACDLIVAAADAFFQAPFTQRGVVPDGGAAWMLSRRVGPYLAAEWLFTGARLPAGQALEHGLVNRVVAAGEALSAATTLAETLVAASPHAVELTKRLLHAAADVDLERYFSLELATAAVAQAGPDAAEGRLAFRDRRAPHWQITQGGAE